MTQAISSMACSACSWAGKAAESVQTFLRPLATRIGAVVAPVLAPVVAFAQSNSKALKITAAVVGGTLLIRAAWNRYHAPSKQDEKKST